MSVDPAAASGGGAGAAGVDALIAAELNALAADAQALQQLVSVGDVVNATVLPSNGLSDLLTILGNRVAASLPPTLVPGDTITARVTGFNGDQILLQVLSTSDGSNQTPSGGGTSTTTAPGTPASTAPVPAATASEIATAATPAPPSPGLAPPASAFVAASVRPNAPTPLPIAPGTTAPEPELTPGTPGTIPGAPGTTVVAAAFAGIEARLAAARAASVTVAAPAPPAGPASPGGATNLTPNAPAPSAQPLLRGIPSPPPAAPGGAAASGGSPAPAGSLPPAPPNVAPPLAPPGRSFVVPPTITVSRFVEPLPVATGANAPPPPAATLATFQDPVNLVRALQLPVTPTNVAAAQLALSSPQRLPAALATLESALPQSDDPRVATYRTITAFVGKIEPSSPQLATQIAAYVEHVVSGSEPALAQLLAAHATADLAQAPPAATAAPATAAEADVAAPTAPAAPGAATAAGDAAAAANDAGAAAAAAKATVVAEPSLPAVALAQVVERATNLAGSLKEQLFSLIAGPPASSGDDVVPAAASALTAVTAVQMSAVQAAAAMPGTISFAIPMFLGSGVYAQAQVAVDRDAPDAQNVPLDGDNFHIAFVLDTKHLGTVAIDLRTVGRAFSLSVKTENLRTAQRFGDELSRLTDRLSSLRYQAKSVEAVVAAPGSAPSVAPVITSAVPARAPADGVNERA